MQPIAFAEALSQLASTAGRPMPKVGTGLAQGGIDIGSMYKNWYASMVEAQTNGQDFPQFKEWLAIQGISNPAMPR